MGSEQNARNGLKRAGDVAQGYPTQFTVIGLDVTPDKLKRRYEGTKRHAYACEVIDAAVQMQRTKAEMPAWLPKVLRAAKSIPAIEVVDLGIDAKEKNWVIVLDGRHRTKALRIVNEWEETEGRPARMLKCVYRTFAAASAKADATMVKIGANLRVVRTHSQRAEDAADMDRMGYSHEDIAPYAEAKDMAEVEMLIMLSKCAPEVQAAVDSGDVALAKVKVLHKLPADEQVRRVTRATAGENRAAQNAAAPPRAKTRPARELARLADAFRDGAADAIPKAPAQQIVLDVLAFVAGGEPAAWLAPVAAKLRDASTEK